MFRHLGCAFAMLGLFSVVPLMGQVTTATLHTIVTDSTGAIIRGATLELRHDATGITRAQACDDLGECSFPFLPPGAYSGSIKAPGFKTLEIAGLTLDATQNLRRKFVLTVGDVVEKVSVSGTAPIVNAVSPEQLETLGGETLAQLPVLPSPLYAPSPPTGTLPRAY